MGAYGVVYGGANGTGVTGESRSISWGDKRGDRKIISVAGICWSCRRSSFPATRERWERNKWGVCVLL